MLLQPEPHFSTRVAQCSMPIIMPDLYNRKLRNSEVKLAFPCGSEVKASAWNAGDPGLILGLGRFPGGQIIAQDDTGHK